MIIQPPVLTADFDLSGYNTLGLPAHASFGTVLADQSHLETLFEAAASAGLPVRVLGGGSNVVMRPRLDAVVALMALKGRRVLGEEAGATIVEVAAGENWDDVVGWTVEQGLWGLENLSLIPGTVGAAPVQNIGAYGVELKDRFHSLDAFDTVERRLVSFEASDCLFAYRHSRFKQAAGRYVITTVRLALPRPWAPVLTYAGLDELPLGAGGPEIRAHVVALRQSKLPDWRQIGNVGSFFHNPIVSAAVAEAIADVPRYLQADGSAKLSAAWLIQQSGFKGYRVGGAGVSDRHALVIVNHGGATFEDVELLSSTIRDGVRARFGVDLVQEPETL